MLFFLLGVVSLLSCIISSVLVFMVGNIFGFNLDYFYFFSFGSGIVGIILFFVNKIHNKKSYIGLAMCIISVLIQFTWFFKVLSMFK